MIRRFMQKIVYKTSTFIALTALVIAGLSLNLAVSNADDLSINTTTDCNANSVIYCGATSVTGLINNYDNGDGVNAKDSIKHIYSYFNITSADINGMAGGNSIETVSAGKVDKDGNVYDSSGKLVARNAITAGRQYPANSTPESVGGTNFYVRPVNVSFTKPSLSAYVVMLNGRFAYAILASCGNPVIATGVSTPAPTPAPKPQPKPTPAPTPTTTTQTKTVSVTNNVDNSCSGNIDNVDNGVVAAEGGNCSENTTIVQAATTSAPSTPTPFGQCSGIAVNIISNNPLEISVSASASTGNGAALTGTSFNYGDGTITGSSPQTTSTHTYASINSYTITATETFSGSPAVAPSTCQTQLTAVAPPPTPVVTAAAVTPSANTNTNTNLPNTGPGNVIVLFGVSSLIGLVGYRTFLQRRLHN